MRKFKRVLAFLLSFVMIISSVNLTSALTVNAAEDTETQALEGSGTQTDPWLISDAEDFVLMSSLISSDAAYADDYYQMTNDIDFTDVTMTAIGKSNHFSGVFDGQLYAVRNLTLKDTSENTGLFAYVENGVVTNLGVEDSTITGGNKTGALIGRTMNAVVLNCYSTNTTVSGKDSTGGIVGMFNSSQMYNCYSGATVSGTSSVGGICGALNSSLDLNNLVTVDNVYSTATVSGNSNCGSIAGWDEGYDRKMPVNVSNAYYYGTLNASGKNPDREATLLTEAQITDGTLVNALNANVRGIYAKWRQEEGSAPKFAAFEMDLTGEGTEESPYLIKDVADFLEMTEAVNASPYYAGAYYRMENSLDLKDVDITGIASANPFGGTFDGAGHVLKNVNISNGSTNYTGLFCKVEGGTIKNLGIESGTIKGGYYVGGFAGYANQATIINCFNGAEIFGYSCVGGLAGEIQDSNIYNSFNKGLIRITYKSIGGLAGSAAGASTIRNSYNIGKVNASTYTGNIVGFIEETVALENVYYAADMATKNQPIGNFAELSVEFSGITGMTKAELMSETFAATLNANVQDGDQKWVYGEDHIARFADFEEAAKLDVFMESIQTMTIADNKVQSIVSSDGAYKTMVYGSNNTNVIDLDGNVYQPLTAQTVLLILDIVDTETGEVVKQLDRNVEVTIEGKYADSGSNEVPNVVPGLREWYGLEGNFTVTENTKIAAATGEMKDLAVRIQTYMKDMIGLELEVTEGTGSEGDIVLNYAPERSAELQEEGYEIEISDQIVIEAATETGMFYGAVSIMQILYQDETKTNVPKGYIRDYPEYELRGGMLDAGRKYFALDYVEEIGKYMSWFKMNTLHLHINENSGEFSPSFVLESKNYPAVNSNNGEYVWKQDDYRQMQKELKTFGVNVITEIDSPGHSNVFGLVDSSLVSGGSLKLSGDYYDKSLGLIENLYDEFLDGEDPVIQNAIVHIGTDEASNVTTEVMRSYISDLSQYVLAKDNVDKVVFWGNLGLYYGQTEIDSENVAAQIWDTVDYRADEALASGFEVINSTSDQLYLTITRNNEFGLGSYTNAYVDLALFYDTWKGASDFTTNNLTNPYKMSRGTYMYSEYDILKGNPKVLGAVFCNWNDGRYGFTYDVMEVMTPYIAGIAEKCWYGDADRFETGEEFVEAFNKVGSHAPYANPKYAVDSDGKEVAVYDFDEMTDGMVKDSVNGYDAVVTNGAIETSDGNGVLKLDGTTSVTLPFKGVGYPYTATFDIYLDGTQSQEAVLFSCDACTIYLDYENNGVSFQSDIYTYTFNVDIPTDEWVEVKLTSQMPRKILDSTNTSILTINGTEYKPTKVGGTSKTSNTTILGTEEMFTGIVGSIDNLCITNIFAYDEVLDKYQYEGEGTEESPYLIQTAEDLRMFPLYLNAGLYQDAYFKLTADIDMAGVAYTTAAEFNGTLDGDGYKITNLTISEPSTDYVGLIGYLNKGTIKNLGIEDSTITGSQKVGALAGRTMNATVMNCYSKATVSGYNDVGGLIGQFNSSYMYNCYSAATVTATKSSGCAGGLSGSMNTSLDRTTPVTVDNVYSVATVTCPRDAGVITGWCENYLETNPVYMTNVYYYDAEKTAIGNTSYYTKYLGSYDETALGITKHSSESELTDGTLLTALNGNLVDGYETWVKGEGNYPCFRNSLYDVSELEEALEKAAAIEKDNYTSETITELEKAIEAAEAALVPESQNQIDEAAAGLNAALAALELKDADYTAVDAAIEKVPEDLSVYTKETVNAVNEAVAAVVRGKKITEQSEVDAMAKAIEDAVAGLVNKTALSTAINKAKALDASLYTEESMAAVTEALAVAEAVYAERDAAQADVNAAETALDNAIKALERIPEEPPVEENEVVRIAGADRYKTAYKVANAYKETLGVEKFEAVIVATGENFADALSGSYLATVKNAPILLANGKAENVAQLHAYIKENIAENGIVYILGGEGAVSADVEAIEGFNGEMKRLSGATRYETNLEILAEAGLTGTELLVATGKTFADSLSASATGRPVLLVNPEAELTDEQKAVAESFAGGTIYVLGGEAAVSEEIANVFSVYGEVKRLSGATRYETSVAIAETFFENVKEVVAASGRDENFPDGLCGGPLAATLNVPLLLTQDDNAEATTGYVTENNIHAGYVLGGTAALADESIVDIFTLESAEEIIVK